MNWRRLVIDTGKVILYSFALGFVVGVLTILVLGHN